MADIAMLVAEEYERRLKMVKKMSSDNPKTMSFLASIKTTIAVGDHNLFNQIKVIIDPKTQLGVAALHGLFSA